MSLEQCHDLINLSIELNISIEELILIHSYKGRLGFLVSKADEIFNKIQDLSIAYSVSDKKKKMKKKTMKKGM